MKNAFRQLNAKKDTGHVNYAFGLALMLFVVLVIMYQVQINAFKSSSQGLEDAIVDAALASAIPDIKEYGKSGNLSLYSVTKESTDGAQTGRHIEKLEYSWQMFIEALSAELDLNDDMVPQNQELYGEKIIVNDYRIYNVLNNKVYVWQRSGNSIILTGSASIGTINAPNGIPITKTSVYVDISSRISGLFNVTIDANKKKLVAIENR